MNSATNPVWNLVRICPPFPTKSATTQCPSRCCRSCNDTPANSARRKPQARTTATIANLASFSKESGVKYLKQFLALFSGKPVPGSYAMFLCTLNSADAGSKIRTEQADTLRTRDTQPFC